MEKFKATLSHSQQETCIAVRLQSPAIAKALALILQTLQPQGLNVLHMKKTGQTSKTIVPRKG
jgi:hypothetical protein